MSDRLKIYYNGRITEQQGCGPAVDTLLGRNYVYAAINTAGHRPLYAARQLEFAARSYEHLYAHNPAIDTGGILKAIPELLAENRMPPSGNIVHVHLIPAIGHRPDRKTDIVVSVGEPLPYRGYELLSLRPKAIIANFGLPFAGHRTAVSRMTSGYMDEFAARSGAHIALRADRDGNLVSAGDYPLCVASGGKLITPPRPNGTGSVEHELIGGLCRMAGLELHEAEISCNGLAEAEEIMVFGPTGIRSLLSCGGIYLYNLIATELEKHLHAITEAGFSA